MAGRNILYKYSLRPYNESDRNEDVAHRCWLCGKTHTLPRNDWVLLIMENRLTKRQKLRLVCKKRLWTSKFI